LRRSSSGVVGLAKASRVSQYLLASSFHATRGASLCSLLSRGSRATIGLPHGRFQSTAATTATSTLPGPKEDILPLVLAHPAGVGGVNDVLYELRKEYGDLYACTIGGQQIANAFHPDAIEKIFRAEGKYPVTFLFESWDKLQKTDPQLELHHNVAFRNGSEWKRIRNELQRRVLPPLEAQKFIKPLAPVMRDASSLLSTKLSGERWRSDNPPTPQAKNDLKALISRVTLEGIGMILYGDRMGALAHDNLPERTATFIQAVGDLFESTMMLEFGDPTWRAPEASRHNHSAYGKMADTWQRTLELGALYLEEAKERLAKDIVSKDQEDSDPLFLLPYLLKREQLTMPELNTNAVGLFIGGVDTTSVSLQWICYWLAKNPHKQQRLFEELTSVLRGGDIDDPRLLQKLPYVKNVVKESSRLSPTAPGTVRTIMEDVAIDGHTLPAGTKVNVFMNLLGRDEKYYKNADQFIPERWDIDEKASDNKNTKEADLGVTHGFAHMPFGFGPRMCLGARLAQNEMYQFLARVVQDCELVLVDPSQQVRQVVHLVGKPDPTPKIAFERRRK
jgi:cytochrome P450